MFEKRKFVRIAENMSISYQVMHTSKTGDFLTRDMSLGGISFYVSEFIPKDTVLKIKIDLTHLFLSLEALVRVVWVVEDHHKERYEVGAEFLNLSEDDTRNLFEYVSSVLRREKK
ncbi:MAG: PilZ domain-containing protein [Candidatus Omnitrophica bacterium]|nr:PilZ domain-containing protein [Candidatus Omnitrophota bacterium]